MDKLKGYGAHLKSLYKTKKKVASVDEDNWPPPVLKRTFRLAMIKPEDVQRVELATDYVQKTITGKVDDILRHKVPTELKDILKEGEQKTVLMEGAPGCGKSTLSLQICHQWAIGKLFQEYTQVILARLREHVVQMAASIADFLPQHSKARGEVIEEELIASNGKGVLFVLDGWDELPRDAPGRSIIKDLLERTKLPECSVIITSRPTSSARLHDVVDSRIEILGFTEEELGNFFAACLDDNIKNAKLLRQRIQENPIVTASCYLPLNASILVYLFKFTQKLPVTKFGIFSSLVRVHIYRHMMKTKQTIPCIDSLDKLPPAVEGPFKNICKMAYQGVMEDRIIFVNPGHDFNTLGLLQGVESFSDGGMSHSFNFLHLSIQEMLAAIYMATELTPEEQVARFRELFGRARFSAVFQFYAAKTKLQTPGIDDVLVDALSMCIRNRKSTELTPSHLSGQRPFGDSNIAHKSQPLLLSLLHCLYEAQDEILYESVVKRFTDLKLNLTGVSLNPADCLVVGSFLTHCSHFYVNVQQCSIGVEGCKTLFRPGAVYDLRIMMYVFISFA